MLTFSFYLNAFENTLQRIKRLGQKHEQVYHSWNDEPFNIHEK